MKQIEFTQGRELANYLLQKLQNVDIKVAEMGDVNAALNFLAMIVREELKVYSEVEEEKKDTPPKDGEG